MEEISSPSKKKKRMSRACWLWLHAAGMAALTILFLALPMYETKVGEERFAFGFFFEATRGMDAAPTAVYYAFFGIFLAASLLACAFAFLALRFEKDGKARPRRSLFRPRHGDLHRRARPQRPRLHFAEPRDPPLPQRGLRRAWVRFALRPREEIRRASPSLDLSPPPAPRGRLFLSSPGRKKAPP